MKALHLTNYDLASAWADTAYAWKFASYVRSIRSAVHIKYHNANQQQGDLRRTHHHLSRPEEKWTASLLEQAIRLEMLQGTP